MTTITVKDPQNADVIFSRLGGDLTRSRYACPSEGSETRSVSLSVEQKVAPFGSAATNRHLVKIQGDDLIEATHTVGSAVRPSGVSVLITRAPSASVEDVARYWALIKEVVDLKITALLAGETI